VQSRRFQVRASLDKNPDDVAAMFDAVARRYDVMNSLASLGQDRQWRLAVVDALEPRPGQLILDLAAGTGTSARPLVRAGARVICVDLSFGMADHGRRRHPDLSFVLGDALRLPFADAAFDAATISFGLRNVADTAGALGELRRVVKPGGRLVVCEFSTPTWPAFRTVYHGWIKRVMPRVARVASADPAAYTYLTESILGWPDQKTLAQWIEQAGWAGIEWRNLSGGVVALHRATRPDEPAAPAAVGVTVSG
jgi:demethylmenaquinone methyltransferase/2-methoxy-6-polyprenyl-1,4-benzoquinol methylase